MPSQAETSRIRLVPSVRWLLWSIACVLLPLPGLFVSALLAARTFRGRERGWTVAFSLVALWCAFVWYVVVVPGTVTWE